MITLDKVTKIYKIRTGYRTVLNSISLTINKTQKIAILGRNGAGKSTLIKLISGVEKPTYGKITHNMSISWPLAFSGGFQGSLTGMDNLRFICRIYNADIQYVKDYVEDFSELGPYMYEPIKTYSSGMKARLAFALSLAIDFDCLLIDEVIAVGDARFNKKCQIELFDKRKDKAMIMVSHNKKVLKQYCDSAYVLDNGILHKFDKLEDASSFYNSTL